jgi:hypothetical protein
MISCVGKTRPNPLTNLGCFSLKLRQKRHPERSASRIYRVTQRLMRGVEGPRRCLIHPCCSDLFDHRSPRTGSCCGTHLRVTGTSFHALNHLRSLHYQGCHHQLPPADFPRSSRRSSSLSKSLALTLQHRRPYLNQLRQNIPQLYTPPMRLAESKINPSVQLIEFLINPHRL